MAKKHSADSKDVIVRNVKQEIKETLVNIAKNKGVTLTAMMRDEFNAIIERSPDSLKRPFLED